MENESRIYARKIFLAHLALVVVVLAAVVVGAMRIYASARAQAVEQASERQELLAEQIGRGIENFYNFIASDLELLGGADTDDTHALAATTRPHFLAFYPLLWNQLSGRVSALLVYDRGVQPPEKRLRVLEAATPDHNAATNAQLSDELQILIGSVSDWMGRVHGPSVSRLLPVRPGSVLLENGQTGGVNLVCVPFVDGEQRLLVAVVPAPLVQTRFLPQASGANATSATLVDDNLAVIASTSPPLSGTNLKEIEDPTARQLAADFQSNPKAQSVAFEHSITIAGSVLAPHLMTVVPVSLPQATWCLLVTSPMSAVDSVVAGIFRTVVGWASFLVVAMTAVLVSTAVQMIRSRLRVERLRHHLLTRELSQARQIQLQWLPSPQSAGPALDVAAVNQPASHISGDFYNWFDLPGGRQVVTIGDVTGHGMPAAFLMATTQWLVRSTMPACDGPADCLREINRQLCTQVFHGQFVTMLIMVLDLQNGTMDVASAGQAAPLVSHDDGPFAPLNLPPQLVLAVDDQQMYQSQRFKLSARTNILLYTDGAVDVQNEQGQRLEPAQLSGFLNGNCGSAQAMIDQIVACVSAFRGKRQLQDDLTLVAIQAQASPRDAPVPPLQRHETLTVAAR
jgi:serine phosphatase RsbU (regulator of sigma subunit)